MDKTLIRYMQFALVADFGKKSIPNDQSSNYYNVVLFSKFLTMMKTITGIDITTCPVCNQGKMQLYDEIPKSRARAPNKLLCVGA